jgi:hypothetical protein
MFGPIVHKLLFAYGVEIATSIKSATKRILGIPHPSSAIVRLERRNLIPLVSTGM